MKSSSRAWQSGGTNVCPTPCAHWRHWCCMSCQWHTTRNVWCGMRLLELARSSRVFFQEPGFSPDIAFDEYQLRVCSDFRWRQTISSLRCNDTFVLRYVPVLRQERFEELSSRFNKLASFSTHHFQCMLMPRDRHTAIVSSIIVIDIDIASLLCLLRKTTAQ